MLKTLDNVSHAISIKSLDYLKVRERNAENVVVILITKIAKLIRTMSKNTNFLWQNTDEILEIKNFLDVRTSLAGDNERES